MLKACDFNYYKPSDRSPYKIKRPNRLRDRAILLLFYDTGVRVSELISIRHEDVDLSNNRILVTGKGKKRRYVFLGKATTQAIWKYTSSRFPKQKPANDEYLFVNRDGFPLTRNAVRQLLNYLGEKAEVSNVHPHRFRHSFAIAYIRNGGDPFSLQDILGHTTMEMVRRYLHLARADIQQIHQRASPSDRLLKR